MNQPAAFFFQQNSPWQSCYIKLREILSRTQLKEECKWGKPCYTLNGKNIVLIHGFKNYCALLFHKGVLLHDPQNKLVQQTENVQSARQLRFQQLQDILALEDYILSLVNEAIQLEKQGVTVELKSEKQYVPPAELLQMFEQDPEFKTQFNALTPGRQRGYFLHFSSPKQSKTRWARIEKSKDKIALGKGFNER